MLTVKSTVYEITEEDKQNYPFKQGDTLPFYDFLKQELCKDAVKVDCTKIEVARNLYIEFATDNGLAMLFYGPKCGDDLGLNQIRIHEGFFIMQ